MNSDQNSEQNEVVPSILLPENKKVFDLFTELSELYFRDGQSHRGATFNKAARLLNEQVDMDVNDAEFDFTSYPGIGPSTAKELKQFITKGTSTRLDEMRATAEASVEFQLSDLINFLKDKEINTTMLSIKLLRAQINTLDKLEKAVADGIFPDDVVPVVFEFIKNSKVAK